MKKIALLLLMSLLISAVSSCGGEPTESKTSSSDDTTPAEETVDTEVPIADLDGYKFRILSFGDHGLNSMWAEAETGSLINDAVYKKIRTVEERLNCDITLAENASISSGTGNSNLIKSPILADEDAFDLVGYHDITLAGMSLEGMFINLYKIPSLDFSKPWWPEFTVESLSVGNKMYLFSNYLSYQRTMETHVLFFNKTLLTDNGVDFPYSSVKDGSWTFDKLSSITKLGNKDLNGDSVMDENDQYGAVNNPYYYGVMEAYRLEPYQHDADGNLTYVFDLDKYQTLVEKLFNFFRGEGSFTTTKGSETFQMFANGQAMFTHGNISEAITIYSASNVIYGVLPMPKVDETQDDYYSGCNDKPLAVPITAAPNIDKIGMIIENLSAEGYRQVYPVLFEQALKARYADQSEDADMFDIINKNSILSFSYIYGENSPYNNMLEKLFAGKNPNTNVASYAASIKASQEKRVATLNEKFAGLD